MWFFALLARLDKPIDGDMSSTLRSLFRSLAEIRASCPAGDGLSDRVVHCNMLLTIIDRCFEQRVACI
jgi:hypothetical protein